MHLDGFFKNYIPLEELIPVKYEDFLNTHLITPPLVEFANKDLIYKRVSKN